MDVDYFLKVRTVFVRNYYLTAVAPFEAIKRKIENGEPPYEPACSEGDDEPPFLEEWLNAETGAQIVGRKTASRHFT